MDVSLKAKSPEEWEKRALCFNPCSFGCQSERRTGRNTSSTSMSFNPCSFGCQSESQYTRKMFYPLMRVSILVLLDVSLKVNTLHPTRCGARCFNPCSFGCQSESTLSNDGHRPSGPVSILVLLDVSLKARRSGYSAPAASAFQSLFFWMSV